MLDHVSIAVGDPSRAERFYDAVFAVLDIVKVGAEPGWIGYGERVGADHPERSYLSLRPGYDVAGSQGRHWCFKAPSRASVRAFWAAGLAAGGTNDGPPGLRPHYHASYYAAFLIDPDGNRIEAVCHLPE